MTANTDLAPDPLSIQTARDKPASPRPSSTSRMFEKQEILECQGEARVRLGLG
jgi:hypothetical protein